MVQPSWWLQQSEICNLQYDLTAFVDFRSLKGNQGVTSHVFLESHLALHRPRPLSETSQFKSVS